MVAKCGICGREFKNTQGLRGHRMFVHRETGSSSSPAVQPPAEQLGIAVNKSTDEPKDPAEMTAEIEQLYDDFDEMCQQVAALVPEVKSLKSLESTVLQQETQHGQQLQQLKDGWASRYQALENSIAGCCQLVNQQLSAARSDTSIAVQRVEKLAELLLKSKEGIDALDKAVSQTKSRIDTMERSLVSFGAELAAVKSGLGRQPTGKLVEMETKGKTHLYKEYWSGKGLLKPHLQSDDFIFGKRWVDLAEPED